MIDTIFHILVIKVEKPEKRRLHKLSCFLLFPIPLNFIYLFRVVFLCFKFQSHQSFPLFSFLFLRSSFLYRILLDRRIIFLFFFIWWTNSDLPLQVGIPLILMQSLIYIYIYIYVYIYILVNDFYIEQIIQIFTTKQKQEEEKKFF